MSANTETHRWPAQKKPLQWKEDASGCWNVVSHAPNKKGGYPCHYIQRTKIRLARWLWEELFGVIPEGMEVCHHCDNPKCINPEHLFLATHRENMQDCAKKGRVPIRRGENNPSAKLTVEDIREIRSRYRELGDSHSEKYGRVTRLAQEFGVTRHILLNAALGRSWRHVT